MDVVYTMHLDLIESRAQTDRIVTGIAVAMGSEIDVVELGQARKDYDTYLMAPPDKPVDREKLELMQALGIAA